MGHILSYHCCLCCSLTSLKSPSDSLELWEPAPVLLLLSAVGSAPGDTVGVFSCFCVLILLESSCSYCERSDLLCVQAVK